MFLSNLSTKDGLDLTLLQIFKNWCQIPPLSIFLILAQGSDLACLETWAKLKNFLRLSQIEKLFEIKPPLLTL